MSRFVPFARLGNGIHCLDEYYAFVRKMWHVAPKGMIEAYGVHYELKYPVVTDIDDERKEYYNSVHYYILIKAEPSGDPETDRNGTLEEWLQTHPDAKIHNIRKMWI
ncbi:hypothetical protein M6B38_274360 [Iris pallida]|uniref:Uncharacterized protein n=1 Tax=Iris pallida TaxID=29817 RepID=A0AAX6I6E9_IRIPA|nr:hypothetical protein M6B38_274360 [Iris pallida]